MEPPVAKGDHEPAAPEPFAAYLTRLYIADKGYRPGTTPEAAPLVEASDVVLTYADGMSFSILCILDAEEDPARRFDFDPELLLKLGRACLHYAGKMNGAQLPVGIRIIEIRRGITEADQRRLARLHRMPGLAKVAVNGFVISPPTGEVWSTFTFGWLQERWFRKLLTSPRRTPEELAAPAPALAADDGPPWLTFGLMGLCATVFVGELALGVTEAPSFLTPSIDTLIALGGASRALVQTQGEWWRLFTATLLHADPIHLALNGLGLYLGGAVLESLLGRAWLGALFVIGALGGSLASVAINAPNLVSVGASGAIMGLLAAALVASLRLPAVQRLQVQMPLMRMLIPSLLPIAMHRSEGHVDFAAHFGGAIAGAAAGLALMGTWPRGEPHPRFRRAAGALAIAGALLYAIGFAKVQGAYAASRDSASVKLISNEQLKTLSPEGGAALLVQYPRDPRAHWFAGMHAANTGDLAGAERHVRAGLAEEGVLQRSFGNRKLEAAMRATLARVLDAEGRHADAIEAARPACDTGSEDLRAYCP